MRVLKLVGIAIGGLVVLIILALLAVRLFVDPNDYKDRIARAVKTSTGRDLTLAGPIKLAVFPWIALEIGPATLGNPSGFGAEPFAAVEHASFRVKLLPLLRKQLEIGHVEIDGLDLRLRKNAAGKGNWQDFAGGNKPPEAPSSGPSSPGTFPELAGVDIKNSRLSYQDTVADHVNLELGHLTAGAPLPVKVHLQLTTGPGAKPIDLTGQLVATLDPRKKRYRIAPLEIQGTMNPAASASPVDWKFSIPELDVDLASQTMSIPGFNAELAAARLAGKLQGSKIVDAPAFSGSFKLAPISLRDLMTKLGIALPQTRDPKALSKLAAQGNFTYGTNALATQDLDIQLDDSRLRGHLALTNLTTKATAFDLSIDRVNLDNYRAPEGAPAATANTRPAKTPANAAQPAADPLKTLDMNGTLRIGAATVAALNVSEVLVTVAAKDAITHIAPAKAKLYGGDFSGDITLDSRGATPFLKLDQSLTHIDVASLLKDFAKKAQHISGRGTVTTNLTAHALSGDALLKTLNGHVAANLDNGAIEGIDLWFEINRAIALIQKQTVPAGSSSGRTRFDTFKASADLADGVASTKDLNIASQNLRVSGQGTANLVTDAINYQVKATILKEAPTAAKVAGNTLADIPLNITGTLTSPSVRPDLEGMAKARVQQEIDKRKGELQQQLMDKLKGILK